MRFLTTSRPGRHAVAATLALSFALGACGGGGESTGPSATPAAIRLQNGSGQTGNAGSALALPLSVVVTDASGRTLSGVRVDWDAAAGAGSFNPPASTTNRDGVATSTWTLGTVAGTARATAQVSGLNPVTFTATVNAAAVSAVVATPPFAFVATGDTVRVRATARDQYGNEVSGSTVAFSSLEPLVASVNGEGLVTALAVGTARIVATAGTRADTVPVTVQPAGASLCGPRTPRVLALGEVITPENATDGMTACIEAPTGVNGEYALVLVSSSSQFGSSVSLDVFGTGNTGPTVAADGAAAVALEAQEALRLPAAPRPQAEAERQRRLTEQRELAPLTNDARDWFDARASRGTALRAAEVRLGDIIRLNANANQGCSNADLRYGRVAAIGRTAIVVSDTANPTGGYTDSEYADIVATFDTLIYPLDTTAFGAPTNISSYGKVVLFYTRNVNALTPSGAGFTIGGFFFQRDLYPKTARNGLLGCDASNEAEMLYLLVPDPNGVVNGNRRTKTEITALNLGTLAHELQHLINSSRRLYLIPGAVSSEEAWLDEGLSHVAEELLYLRVSGYTSRQNITLQDVQRQSTNFSNFAAQNFSRFYSFLINPEATSPYAPNDSLSTRGAIWSFLRFVAGRQGSAAGEAVFLRALTNSPTIGFNNLNAATGGQIADYLRDWAVSNIADDFSAATIAALDPKYQNVAWNFRSIYPGLRFGGGPALGVYPINARQLQNNALQRLALAGGTSSYVRFGIPAGRRMLLTMSSNGATVPGTVRYALVRLR